MVGGHEKDFIMNEDQDLQRIELSIEEAKQKIDLAKSLEILQNNVHFKKLITENFLEKRAIALVQNRASYDMQTEASQKFIDAQLVAIGQLGQYLRFVAQEGAMAKEAMKSDEEEREAILKEAL